MAEPTHTAAANATPVAPNAAPPQRTPRIATGVGAAAGLLAVGLILGLVGGVAWALLRPTYTVSFEDGAAVIQDAAAAGSVEFAAVGWLSIITGAIGIGLACIARRQVRNQETGGGIGTMLWLIVAAAASSFTVFAAGEMTVRALHPVPSHGEAADQAAAAAASAAFDIAPSVDPHVAWLVGPFAAAFTFWLASSLAYWRERLD